MTIKQKILGVIKVSGEVIGSKNPRGLKNYLANLTEFLENPRGLLCQCALPCANPWGHGNKKSEGYVFTTYSSVWGVWLKNGMTVDVFT